MAGREGNAERRPDAPQRSIHRLPLPAFLGELSPAPGRDPVVLAAAAALRNFPPRLDVAEPLEPMQNGVEHPVRPLHAPSGQLPNSLEDGVAVAVLFGQDRQDDRGRGSGYQVLVDLHDFTPRAALTNSNISIHSGIIHGSARYVIPQSDRPAVGGEIDVRRAPLLGRLLYAVAGASSKPSSRTLETSENTELLRSPS